MWPGLWQATVEQMRTQNRTLLAAVKQHEAERDRMVALFKQVIHAVCVCVHICVYLRPHVRCMAVFLDGPVATSGLVGFVGLIRVF